MGRHKREYKKYITCPHCKKEHEVTIELATRG